MSRVLRSIGWLIGLGALACSPELPKPGDSEPSAAARGALALAEHQTLTASDALIGSELGLTLALSGEWVFATSDRLTGAVYAFSRAGGATFTERQVLSAGVGVGAFTSLSAAGSTVLAGAAEAFVNRRAAQGAVYVFDHDGASWVPSQALVLADGVAEERFGSAVAVSGSTALVTSLRGLHVFERTGPRFTLTQTLVPSGHEAADGTPTALAFDGNTALVGVDTDDGFYGAVYVFVRGAAGFAEQQRLLTDPRAAQARFGMAVSLAGDRALVSAPFHDGISMNAGVAYTFVRNGGVWTREQRLLASDGVALDVFGRAVALTDDLAFIGAYRAQVGNNALQGAVYAFELRDQFWYEQARLAAGDGVAESEFGWTVAADAQTLVVGAPQQRAQGLTDSGAAYVFAVLGRACGGDAECLSGHCRSGVCCDRACAGACEVCRAALGAPEDGRCGLASAGFPGDPSCAPLACTGQSAVCAGCSSDAECPPERHCDAAGECQARKPRGAACDPRAGADCREAECRSCEGELGCVDGVCCDGACDGECDVCSRALGASEDGVCTPIAQGPGAPVCRGGFACSGDSGECPDACENDAGCRASHYCGATGACEPRTCERDRDCGTGARYCADGICCDTPCTGQCEACDVRGAEGVCTALTGAPRAPRQACAEAGAECGGSCDGMDRERCAYPPASTPCGGSSCADGVASSSECDGAGACVENAPRPCAPYVCGADACLTECENDADCTSGNRCAEGRCRFRFEGSCDAERRAALDAEGQLVARCEPYFCSEGRCEDRCHGSDDCQPGYGCDAGGRCVAFEPETADPGGCSCRLPHTADRQRGAPFALFALFALALACRRRRRAGAR